MPRHPTLTVQAKDLGFASILASSRRIDWQDVRGDDCEGFEVVLPTLTLGIVAQYAPDLLTPAQTRAADKTPNRPAPESLVDQFQGEPGYFDWRDAFEPMMSYVWPAFIPYGMDSQALADALDRHAGPITLIDFGDGTAGADICGERYGFAFSGGGMNLSDYLAIAYLCAHQVPPLAILEGLSGVIDSYKLGYAGATLRRAYRRAAEFMRYRAKRLGETSAKIFSA